MENSDIFKLNQRQPECKQGGLLIAQPFLQELYFNHSCICLVDYKPKMPVTGLVLNKKTNFYLDELVENIEVDRKIPIFCGGPMSMDKLFFIHTYPGIENSQTIIDGLYFNGNFDRILDYINSGLPIEGHIKFFIGYSGWDRMQLPEEIDNHVWAVSSGNIQDFLSFDTDNYWYDCVKNLGKNYRSWLLCPVNPSLN